MSTVKFDKIKISAGDVIIRTFYSDISICEVINSFEYLLENYLNENNNYIGIITDLKQANLKFSLSEFREMLSFIKLNNTLSALPLAVIFDTPIQNLFPAMASKTLGDHLKPFNSIDEAILWIENFK